MDDRFIILHLSLIEHVGPQVIHALVARLALLARPLGALYVMSALALQQECGLSEPLAHAVHTGLADMRLLETELQIMHKHHIAWATMYDEDYPALLKEITCPPAVLFWQGNSKVWQEHHCFAVIGSRKANEYGQQVVQALVPGLVQAGWVIVSGGALGADSMAHEATLQAGGTTIAVLGAGLLNLYPASNKKLFASIVEQGGVLMSPFPARFPALPGNFPARNRIISGLSYGCLVVQAAEKSGASITAHYALDQGRDVFAVPGAVYDPLSAGCHRLIQQGAKLVCSLDDILQEYVGRGLLPSQEYSQQIIGQQVPAVPAAMSRYPAESVQARIIALCAKSITTEGLLGQLTVPYAELMDVLFELQMDGAVRQSFDGSWAL